MKKSLFLLLLVGWVWPYVGWGQQLPKPTPTEADQVLNAAGGLAGTYIQASLDLAHQRLYGPSYKGASPNPVQLLLLNFAIQKNDQKLIDQIFKNVKSGISQRTINPPDDATLLASIDPRPGPTMLPEKDSFVSHLSLLYGIQLIGKGGKYGDGFGTSTTKITYLEPTASVLYNYDIPNNKGRVFGGLGPYLAYGLWGTVTYKDSGTTESYGAFDEDSGGYKRFDAGLNFMAGYQLPQGLSLSLVREIGLINMDSGNSADKTFNRVWSLNVGYPLDKLVAKLKKK